MALNQDMYDYLVTISDLTDLVSVNSIFWNDFPEGVVTSVTYKMISNPRKYNAGSVDDTWQRWRFYINHASKVTCKAIADVLTQNLHEMGGDIGGTIVSYIAQIDESDPNIREDLALYEIIQDYSINKH